MDRVPREDQQLSVDIDFDFEGHVIEGISSRSESDPLLQAIVHRMLEGAQVTPEELRYYELATAELVGATASRS